MSIIKELRDKYPEYNKVSDGDLTLSYYEKFMKDKMHVKDFLAQVDPEDTARFTISDKMWPYWEAEAGKPMPGENEAETLERMAGPDQRTQFESDKVGRVSHLLQGGLFGTADNIAGAGGVAIDAISGRNPNPGMSTADRYGAHRERFQGRLERNREENPIDAYGSEMAGAALSPINLLLPGSGSAIGLGRLGANATSTLGRSVSGALNGLTGGSLYALGEGETLRDAAIGGAVSAIPSALASLVLGRIAQRGTRIEPVRDYVARSPTSERLRREASDLFDVADAENAIDREAVIDAYPGILDRMERSGLDMPPAGKGVSNTPKALRAMQRLGQETDIEDPNIRWRDLDAVRTQSNVAAGANPATEKLERKLGVELSRELDALVADLDPALGETTAKAREIWGRLARSEKIQDIITLSENYVAGPESGLRNGMASLLKRIDKGREPGFSQEEIKAMREVVNRTPFGRVLAQFGRFGFSTTGGSNAVGGGIGGLTGAVIGGNVFDGAMAPAITGAGLAGVATGSRRLAELLVRRQADKARAMVASRSPRRMVPLSEAEKMALEAGQMAPLGARPINPMVGGGVDEIEPRPPSPTDYYTPHNRFAP